MHVQSEMMSITFLGILSFHLVLVCQQILYNTLKEFLKIFGENKYLCFFINSILNQ